MIARHQMCKCLTGAWHNAISSLDSSHPASDSASYLIARRRVTRRPVAWFGLSLGLALLLPRSIQPFGGFITITIDQPTAGAVVGEDLAVEATITST